MMRGLGFLVGLFVVVHLVSAPSAIAQNLPEELENSKRPYTLRFPTSYQKANGTKLFFVPRKGQGYEVIAYVVWHRATNDFYEKVPPPTIWLTAADGRKRRLSGDFKRDHFRYFEGIWDYDTNSPLLDVSTGPFARYYYSVTGLLSGPTSGISWALVVVLILVIAWLSRAASEERTTFKDKIGAGVVMFVGSVIVCALGGAVGMEYGDVLANFDKFSAHVDERRLPSGRMLPITITPKFQNTGQLAFLNVIFVPVFISAHVLFIFLLPGVIRGFHFVFVPHPASYVVGSKQQRARGEIDGEELLKTMRAEREKWRPLWVLRARTRKAKILAEEIQAEAEVLKATLDHNLAQDTKGGQSPSGVFSTRKKFAISLVTYLGVFLVIAAIIGATIVFNRSDGGFRKSAKDNVAQTQTSGGRGPSVKKDTTQVQVGSSSRLVKLGAITEFNVDYGEPFLIGRLESGRRVGVGDRVLVLRNKTRFPFKVTKRNMNQFSAVPLGAVRSPFAPGDLIYVEKTP